jgi:hypothetical protein
MHMLDAVTLNKVASVLADLLRVTPYEDYPYNGTYPQLVTPKSGHAFALGDTIQSSVASNIPGGYRVILTDNNSTSMYTRYADVIVAGTPDMAFSFPPINTVGLPAGMYVLQVRKQSPTALDNVHTIRIKIGLPQVVAECDAPVEAKSDKPKKS